MAAPKGNTYYKLATNFKRPKKFTPAQLARKANQYFKWCQENPLYKTEVIRNKLGAELVEVPVLRAFSISGFCTYLKISPSTFQAYRNDYGDEYRKIVASIVSIIQTQQFEGASGNILNSSIISRTLGLTDKKDITSDGKPINDIQVEIILPEDDEE